MMETKTNKVVDMDGNPVTVDEVLDKAEENKVSVEDQVEKLVGSKLRHEVDLMLDIWRCYYLIRLKMIYKSGGTITPEVFQDISSALGTVAAEGFDVGKLRKRVKNDLVGFLGNVANNQFNAVAEEKKGVAEDGGVQQDTDTGAGAEDQQPDQ